MIPSWDLHSTAFVARVCRSRSMIYCNGSPSILRDNYLLYVGDINCDISPDFVRCVQERVLAKILFRHDAHRQIKMSKLTFLPSTIVSDFRIYWQYRGDVCGSWQQAAKCIHRALIKFDQYHAALWYLHIVKNHNIGVIVLHHISGCNFKLISCGPGHSWWKHVDRGIISGCCPEGWQ